MLSCENLKDCENSLESILGVDKKTIQKIKTEVIKLYKESIDWDLMALFRKYGIDFKENTEVCFFHFSRTLEPESYEQGLHVLPTVMDSLIKGISTIYGPISKEKLIENLEKKSHFSSRLRVSDSKSGPYGFLIKEHGLIKDTISVTYIDGSEFVIDVLEAMEFDETLYRLNAKSVIVKYKIGDLDKEEQMKYIKSALEYISLGHSREALKSMNSSHDNHGNAVNKKDIINVEVI